MDEHICVHKIVIRFSRISVQAKPGSLRPRFFSNGAIASSQLKNEVVSFFPTIFKQGENHVNVFAKASQCSASYLE